MRFLPLSGIVFVAIVVLTAIVGGDTPGSDASGNELMAYYDDHEARHVVVAFVLAASVPFLVLFACTLATAVWPGETGRRPLWELVLIGGSLITAAIFLVGALTHFALVDSADPGVGGGALQALHAVDSDTWVAFNPAFGVMMLGAAGALIPRGGTYRRLGWAALPLGIALFIPFADFFALLLTGAWIIVTSLVLFRGQRDVGETVAPRVA